MRATTDAERRAVVATIFAGYLLIGLVLVRSYGGSWDEPFTRDMGERTYRYIAGRLTGDRTPAAVVFAGMNAETGPTFEVVLYSLERLFRLDDGRQILLVRHGATFVMFWLGAVAFYTLLRFRFGRRLWALVGVAFLVLTPRLFAHAFYNSKDAVLVAWFAIAMLTLLRYRRERTFGSACLHAVTCAIATDVRLVGLLLPAVTGVLLLVDLAAEGFRAAAIRKVVSTAIAYGVLLAFLVVLFWPQLWENP